MLPRGLAISSIRSAWTSATAAVNWFIESEAVDLVIELAVVAEPRANSSSSGRFETSTPPSPVEIVLVAYNEYTPASP